MVPGSGSLPKELCRGATDLTTLMDAAIDGHKQLVELLLQRGAEVNKQNSDGCTALMFAAGVEVKRVGR